MRRRMSAAEIEEWRAYYDLEPFGEWRADLRHAHQMALQTNIHRDTKKHPKPFEAKDFMFEFEPPSSQPKQTTQQMLEAARMLTAAFGAKDTRPVEEP